MHCQARPVPRGEKRRDQISAVAESMFLERGYAETTMQLIAERAGASRKRCTGILAARRRCFPKSSVWRSAIMMGGDGGELSGAPQQVLLELALNMLHFLGGADLIRFIAWWGPRRRANPNSAGFFYEQGPGRIVARLSEYVARSNERGDLRAPDLDLAARLFLGAVVAHHQMLRLALRASFAEAELMAHAEEAVRLFMARYGALTVPRADD